MEPKTQIRALVENHKIPFLVHFTRAENIPSIMTHGILSRQKLIDEAVNHCANDELRLDGRLDGISLSIAHPNSKMLWALRGKNPSVAWAVLVISKAVIWNYDCAFCRHNAADARISGVPLEELQSPKALAAMYSDMPGVKRDELGLKAFDPTDVQAEVLVFDRIDPRNVIGAAFQRPKALEEYKEHLEGLDLRVHWDQKFFSDRSYARKRAA